MPSHKSEDYKLSAVDYYLTEDKSQEDVCKIHYFHNSNPVRYLNSLYVILEN